MSNKFKFQPIIDSNNLNKKVYLVSLANITIKHIGIVERFDVAQRSKWFGYLPESDYRTSKPIVEASTRQACAEGLYTLKDNDRIEWVEGIKYIDLSVSPPNKIHICWENWLNERQRINAAMAVEYWLGARCITQEPNSVKLEWGTNNQQLHITADFESGHFQGDLTYHKAIFSGDAEFTIGLVKLLRSGYSTRNRTIQAVGVTIRNIRFYYDELEFPDLTTRVENLEDNKGDSEVFAGDIEERLSKIESRFNSLRQAVLRLEESEAGFRKLMSIFIK